MALLKERKNNLSLENQVPFETAPVISGKRNVEFQEPAILETAK